MYDWAVELFYRIVSYRIVMYCIVGRAKVERLHKKIVKHVN